MFNPYDSIHLSIPQIEEALSAENKFFAAQSLGHEANLQELLIHYIKNTLAYKVAHFDVID